MEYAYVYLHIYQSSCVSILSIYLFIYVCAIDGLWSCATVVVCSSEIIVAADINIIMIVCIILIIIVVIVVMYHFQKFV